MLDTFGEPHPAFELGMRRLAEDAPTVDDPKLVHGDFRNGNLVVDRDGLRAVLDWELAHLGDPIEDLGWLCVKSWRFGLTDRHVGGFGDVDALCDAYAAAGGEVVDRDRLRWWEALGTLKWGVICEMQAQTHLQGLVRSVELATLGRRIAEMEWDLLDLLDALAPATARPTADDRSTRLSSLQDRPSAAELLEAVREFLDHDVLAAVEGRVRSTPGWRSTPSGSSSGSSSSARRSTPPCSSGSPVPRPRRRPRRAHRRARGQDPLRRPRRPAGHAGGHP